MASGGLSPRVHCSALATTFIGVQHPFSSPEFPILQFRGIKYARIPARFRRSLPHTQYQRVTDATTHGPIAPHPQPKWNGEPLFEYQPEHIPKQCTLQDEFECLNLTITTPAGLAASPFLPVMVWIHGGGNVAGSGSSWMTDAGRLVGKSIELNRPVIVVAVNYRLGLLGFGASPDLEEDNRKAGESGVGNYGLYDQLNALTWVRNHISSFGGDPSMITLFGESTGAINAHALLLSRANQSQSVASRAIIQSGVVKPDSIPSVASQGSLMSRVMSRLNITTVEELRSVDVNILVSHTPNIMSATDDGVFFRPGWKTCPVPEGVQSLIIGDCMVEPALYARSVSLWTTNQIVRRVRAIIRGMYKADAFLRKYGITCHTSDEEARLSVLNIINDVLFAWPTETTVRSVKPGVDVFRYLFDQESEWTGISNQAVDLLYLFDNVPPTPPCRKVTAFSHYDSASASDYDSDSDSEDGYDYTLWSDNGYNASRIRGAIQERWIAFANGERPWSPDKVYVFGPEGEIGERDAEELCRRRRLDEWREAFGTISPEIVHKVALELMNGPPVSSKATI